MWGREVLWQSTVGSRMWGMEHGGSDIDLFEVNIIDLDAILCSENIKGGVETHYTHCNTKIDKSAYEIGHVVQELQKGNINFLWGVMSPLVEYPLYNYLDSFHTELKKIILDNLSKNYFWAIRGMMGKNLWKYFSIRAEDNSAKSPVRRELHLNTLSIHDKLSLTKREPLSPGSHEYSKKLKMIYRNLQQGAILLGGKVIRFLPYQGDGKYLLEEIFRLYEGLRLLYHESDLPLKPDRKPFDEFLARLRRFHGT